MAQFAFRLCGSSRIAAHCLRARRIEVPESSESWPDERSPPASPPTLWPRLPGRPSLNSLCRLNLCPASQHAACRAFAESHTFRHLSLAIGLSNDGQCQHHAPTNQFAWSKSVPVAPISEDTKASARMLSPFRTPPPIQSPGFAQSLDGPFQTRNAGCSVCRNQRFSSTRRVNQ